jgi:hypothetical protein
MLESAKKLADVPPKDAQLKLDLEPMISSAHLVIYRAKNMNDHLRRNNRHLSVDSARAYVDITRKASRDIEVREGEVKRSLKNLKARMGVRARLGK